MKDSKKIIRRRHSAELKAQVLSECAQRGASVARVALSHGINANIVHRWRRLCRRCTLARRLVCSRYVGCAELLCVGGHPHGTMELRRGATTMTIT